MEKKFWNERYSEEDYVYGKEPNEFFKNEIEHIAPGKMLLPGEGEGRNAVYAAVKGWDVTAYDFSEQAKKKATGKDIVYYKVPAVTGSQYTISAELCYQTLPPRLVTYLQGISSPDIQKFTALYNSSDKSPVIMKTITVPFLTGINPIGTNTPASFKLYQNYPNPFNPSTKIKFDVPNGNKFISLKIYDVLGKEVQTLVAASLRPGSYETDFEANGLSSGMFFCVLRAERFYEIKRMIYIK